MCRLPVRSTHRLQLVPIAVLSQMPGAGPQPLASGTAARPPQHQLLPRPLHRASRTEPAGADFSQAILRPAVRGQFPDLAGGGRRSQATGCRDRDFCRSCIRGVPTCWAITMSTASSPPEDCRPTTGDGSTPATRCSCCLFPYCAPCSATSSSTDFGSFTTRTSSTAAGPQPISVILHGSRIWLPDWARRSGSFYAKPPFGGPAHVLRYLGRYTHRIAISNHRLLAFDGQRVTFRWRDYAHGSKQRLMTLDSDEFLRRFFLHVLPKGFVRIRRYGLLSNRFRHRLLPLAHGVAPPSKAANNFPCHSFARMRTLALSPLRQSHASRPTLHRRTTLFRRLRFLMIACANPVHRLAPCTSSHQCVRSIKQASAKPNLPTSPNGSIADRSCNPAHPPAISIDDDGRAQKH